MDATFMQSASAGADEKHWSLVRTGLLAAAVVVAVESALLLTGNRGVLHGALFDPDCYMHLQRAYQLMTHGQHMFDPRINAPFGFAIHWTMLFDLLLVAGAAPLQWLGMDAHTALYAWGSAISPLLLIAVLPVFAWGLRRRVEGMFFIWLTVLFFTQPQLSGAFLVGRPDHHSLIMALLLAQLAWLYAYFDHRAGIGWALVAGLLAGIEICTSVEALLTILVVTAVLLSAWVLYGVRTLRSVAAYLGACVATIFAWLLWQQGNTLLTPAYDRVSVVHFLALGSGFLAFAALAAAERRYPFERPPMRLAAAFLAAGLAAAATAAMFPDFYLGPWPHLSPVVSKWHKTISELQPLLPTDLRRAAMFLAQLAGPVFCIPFVLSRLRDGERDERCTMLVTVIGLAVFGPLALAQMRWSAEVQAVCLLPWTLTTRSIMQSRIALRVGQRELPLRSLILVGAMLVQMMASAPLVQAGSVSFGGAVKGASGQGRVCRWSQAITSLRPLIPPNAIVMTELWYGPEIIWRLGSRVVGAPYEITPALEDTNAFLYGGEKDARAIAERRQLSFVLVCNADQPTGFSKLLADGSAPPWLTAVPFPIPEFRLYRVIALGSTKTGTPNEL
jgi:hypothetical protein